MEDLDSNLEDLMLVKELDDLDDTVEVCVEPDHLSDSMEFLFSDSDQSVGGEGYGPLDIGTACVENALDSASEVSGSGSSSTLEPLSMSDDRPRQVNAKVFGKAAVGSASESETSSIGAKESKPPTSSRESGGKREVAMPTPTQTEAAAARAAAIKRFRAKKAARCFDKRIRYECRKKIAASRPRVGGRFAKKADLQRIASLSSICSQDPTPSR
eukprot:Plantae.Rhodophyta-Rhodochaete_pulchella.ctg35355.p1 GENE.Plantae.Rhodophyta-Rhodochaete_pulchella.ctg35355~~Plantae.Rhodophyta-Rhodochaete_pulchella.ctg35355.p1  ORF type:complete len:214 (+),score=25.35 Plantae.Rhodophyta-Rhodochaete_pulchella.ctg35355:119-760(+)